jgi:hypothetical protein
MALPRTDDGGATRRDARYSQSLEKGLAILAASTPERPVLGVAELSTRLGFRDDGHEPWEE